MPIRLILVDGQTVVREGLKLLLESEGRTCVVAEAATAGEALARVDEASCQVVVLDPEFVPCLLEMHRNHPDLPIVVLTRPAGPDLVWAMMRDGARAFVPKTATGHELLRAVEDVCRGGIHVHPQVAGAFLTDVRRGRSNGAGIDISPRETGVLRLVAEGLSIPRMAGRLSLSPNTIKTHLRGLYRKLEVKDRARLVLRAMELGLLAPAPSNGGKSSGR